MTLLRTQTATADSFISYSYGLLNPTTGANTVEINFSSLSVCEANSLSYTGVAQSGLPDAVTGNSNTGTTWSQAITTVANNCWVIAFQRASGPFAAEAPDVKRATTQDQQNAADSDAAITPAGSYTINGTCADSGDNTTIALSIAPAVAGAAANHWLLMGA